MERIHTEPSRNVLRRLMAMTALVLCLGLSGGAIASDERFDQARAAFESASGSRDGNHEGYVRAYAIWAELAEEGGSRALYHIGIMNMYGLGGAEFDQLTGVHNVRAAAEGGYPMAQSFMGFMVERSDGLMVEKGDEAALAWWRKGAQGNHCAAVRRLARAYENGELGLPADAAKAAEWNARQQSCDKN